MGRYRIDKIFGSIVKSVVITFVVLIMCFVIAGCGSTTNNRVEEETAINNEVKNESGAQMDLTPHKIKFTMADGKTFVIQTAPEYAPETCENFVNLVNDGFYDGLTFHRVIDDFVAQGGDPNGDGTGGSSKKIKGEFSENGFEDNTLSHTRGVVSMARSSDPNSASSQFFICYGNQTQLDGSYAAFGEVVEGMETVDGFLDIKRDRSGMPETPIVISEAKVIE